MSSGTRLGVITRITGGLVYVELADVAPGFEYGPCLDTVGTLAVGDRVVTQALARDPDELVITGRIGGADGAYIIPLDRLPVAPSGNANPTQIVRADDARLDNPRTPTAHTHDAADVNAGTLALARFPVAASGVSSATQLVRADDSRLGSAWQVWTPTVTAEAGTFTTATATGRHVDLGNKTTQFEATITITTVGTAQFGVKITLPATAQNATAHVGTGRSMATGAALQVRLSSTTTVTILRYDDATAIGAGAVLRVNGSYERA